MARRRILLWLLVASATIVAIALLVRTSYVAGREFSQSMPRVGFVEVEVPLGAYEWGSTAKTELHFENRTSSPVTLAGVSSTSGCALVADSAALENRVIQPAETITIPVELSVGNSGPTRSAHIVAILDDGRRFSAIVKAQVKRGWAISTQHLAIGAVRLGATDPVSREFSFLSAADRITEVSSAARWLTAEVTDTLEKQQVITVRVDPGTLPPGVNRAALRFSTTNQTVPKGSLEVSARGVTDLHAVPPKLFLRPGSSTTVKFVGTGGTAVELESVDSSTSVIRAELREGGLIAITAAENAYLPQGIPVRVRDRSGREGEVRVTTIHLKGEKP